MKKLSSLNKNARLALFAMLLIFTPTINMVDILPDFIGYFILIKIISPLSYRIPYFDGVIGLLKKLCLISLLRIPALFLMEMIKGENYTGNDQTALFTLIFSAFEGILLVYLLLNLYQAFTYLCERGGYKCSDSDTASLRNISIVLLSAKCFLCFFPTVFLLTRSVEGGYVSYMSKPYPYALTGSIILATAIGIILYKRWRKFFISLDNSALKSSTQALCEITAADAEKKIKLKQLKTPLTLLAVSSLLAFEVVFDNFHNVNILPKFIYAIPLTLALLKMLQKLNDQKRITRHATIATGVGFSVFSLGAFITSILFFEKYKLADLMTSTEARGAFIPIIAFSALELLALVVLCILGARINSGFVTEHTGILKTNPKYTSADKDYHKSLSRRGYLVFGFALLSGIMRFINTVLKFNARLLFTDISDITRPTIITSAVPWFHIAVFAITAIYAVVSLSYFSTLKDEVNIKYEKGCN